MGPQQLHEAELAAVLHLRVYVVTAWRETLEPVAACAAGNVSGLTAGFRRDEDGGDRFQRLALYRDAQTQKGALQGTGIGVRHLGVHRDRIGAGRARAGVSRRAEQLRAAPRPSMPQHTVTP